MLSQHISALILKNFDYEPTISQQKLVDGFCDFIMSQEYGNVLLIKGFAGTGKTTLVSAMVKGLSEMEIPSVLMAPTGRAAKVFSAFAGQPAYTIHKMIYRQKTSGADFGKFSLNWNKYKDTLFIVDEASMIANSASENNSFGSGRLLDDLFEFIFQGHNCKLILMGDTAQLPPVGLEMSPALDEQNLKTMGLEVRSFFLDDVVRQSLDSGILQNATSIREKLSLCQIQGPIKFSLNSHFNDVHRLSGADLINELSVCYDHSGMDETIVICRSNKRANQYNMGIRNSILFREEELVKGDMLMVVKNNYFWLGQNSEGFIANGDVAEVMRVKRYEELYGLRFANVTLRFVDHDDMEMDVKIIMDVLNSESPALGKDLQEKFYQTVLQDYADIGNKRKQMDEMRKNSYFNALQVKYAYAVTCHKAQGGQWKSVFIDQGAIRDEDKGIDYLRWLYTATTRATEKLYWVNFPDKQFE